MTNWQEMLNDRQSAAVMHDEGPLLILAGAGSGKTRVLTCRLSHLIESGVAPERILQLTFTNKAADEMKERAAQMLDERCEQVMACTYHSFSSKMLHEYGSVMGLARDATILNIPDARSVINIVRFQLFRDFPNGYPSEMSLSNIFSSAMNKRISIAAVLDTDQRHRRYKPFLESIEQIGKAYGNYKRDHDMVDYDDLIAMFRQMLVEHEDIRAEIEGRYDYIMVDEYQDTNPMQDDIVFLLRRSNPNLMVVGDDYQSIYAFRGSEVNNILRFPDKEPLVGTARSGEVLRQDPRPAVWDEADGDGRAGVGKEEGLVYLDTNYRSSAEIIALANAVMRSSARFGFPKDMTATFSGGVMPRVVSVADPTAEAGYVTRELRRLHDEEGIAWGEMAVISRTMAGSEQVVAAMEADGIPKNRFGGASILETEVVNDAIAHIRLAVNGLDRLAAYRVASTLPSVGHGNAESVANAMDARMGFLDEPRWQRCSGIEDLLTMRRTILTMRQMGLAEMVDAACARALEADRAAYERQVAQDRAEGRGAPDPVMEEQARARHEREARETLDRFRLLAARYDYPRELLDAIALQELGDDVESLSDDELLLGDDLPQDAVTVSTIHSVKGLEFEAVVILDCVNGVFPRVTRNNIGTADDMEELRCFYVAVTRAKRHLVMMAPGHVKMFGTIRSASESHYLSDIGDDLVERVTV